VSVEEIRYMEYTDKDSHQAAPDQAQGKEPYEAPSIERHEPLRQVAFQGSTEPTTLNTVTG
jgi:hypothetical protein